MSFRTAIVSFFPPGLHNSSVEGSTNAFMLPVMCNVCWSLYAGPCEPVTDGGTTAGSVTLCSQGNYTLHDLMLFQRVLKQVMPCILAIMLWL